MFSADFSCKDNFMYHFGAAPSLQGQSDEKEFEKIP
jgi:hypothetical protein